MANPIALPELFKAGFQDFITPEYISAPFTQIQGRAKVSNSLKAIAGTERLIFRHLIKLDTEFGPNGEAVYESQLKDSRIRFVGGNWLNGNGGWGPLPNTITLNEFCEVTFYGTALNILTVLGTGATRDLRYSLDGGAMSSNILAPGANTTVLGARGYVAHQVVKVVSGLTLGWHTVKLQNFSTTDSACLSGIEIVNERSDLAVLAGNAISKGASVGLSSMTTSSFNAGVSGSRGARVIKYIEGGQLKTAVQEVDAVSKFLTATDHSNEELLRKINFREFGCGRGDDMSTVTTTTSSRNFTLEDGTTTLMGNSVQSGTTQNINGVYPAAGTSDWLTFTFVGTGLDIYAASAAYAAVNQLYVDGSLQGTITITPNSQGLIRLCSGLPYGTHTVKILRTTTAVTFVVSDYYVYVPKKPSIPSGAFAVAEYNVMADYTTFTSVSPDVISPGVITKNAAREISYLTGTWTATQNTTTLTGCYVSNSTAGAVLEYNFFGTGIEIVGNKTTTPTIVIQVDGVNYTGTAIATGTGAAWTAGTATWTPSVDNGSKLAISGLALGHHKIRLTISAATFYLHALNVVTPIHINDYSLRVGSQSLQSNQSFEPFKSPVSTPDLGKAKAWLYFDQASGRILGSYNVGSVVTMGAGISLINFDKPFKNGAYVALGICSSGVVASFIFEWQGIQRNQKYMAVAAMGHDGAYRDQLIHVAFFGEIEE